MMTITLSSETESRLRRKAERSGEDYNSLADALLLDSLVEDLETAVDPDVLTAEETQQIRAGIQRGLQAAEAGRVKSLSSAVNEARQRHGFPDSWAAGTNGAP